MEEKKGELVQPEGLKARSSRVVGWQSGGGGGRAGALDTRARRRTRPLQTERASQSVFDALAFGCMTLRAARICQTFRYLPITNSFFQSMYQIFVLGNNK